ncbi:2-dehydro-3-deoxygalactonokinase [Pseudoruegeria sp. SHC-113]|uniref:2-dehydro-3-deoxygalactonokinase n=1 Tax=Pseudoruegeria sp. SHC-113 TaxID=2855439 RepID=UPI0021BA5AE1|nr:2-dehydro-3-deoxygalactonokinase [Pseudoruegeria sp. SHC-113]MCT8158905.1 2-dehydro-3-deoxygalactonokinase [Pseudoruegeria sp. SHC-113]
MSGESAYCEWIAVDWGTSHLRVYAIAADGSVRAEGQSEKGMGALTPEGFEPALLELIDGWLGTAPMDIMACGMVGSRQGWTEAPYLQAPCKPQGGSFALPPVNDPRLRVCILPGVKQITPAPDVMRGEETQIAGFIDRHPGFDGILCLPGTHTKWVEISAGEIVSFQTFMTGEMFALLSKQSVLRHSVQSAEWDDAAFTAALAESISRPERLAARLFGLRAGGLVADQTPAEARARLSGYLIGAELAGAKPYWLGRQIALIGAPALTSLYETALAAQGVIALCEDAASMTLAGLAAARDSLKEGTQ